MADLRERWHEWTRDPAVRVLLLGVGAGVLGGLAAGAFDQLAAVVAWVMLGSDEPSTAQLPWWRALVFPVLAGALAGAILQASRLERPMGMPRLLQLVQLRGGRVPLREGLVTALAAMIALGGGHSGGREAPVAGLAAALGHAACQRMGVRPGEVRVLVAATAAAAISASFNTPLGSAVLALELILGSFALQAVGPVVAATVTGTVVGQAVLGERVAFHAPSFALGHWAELIAYAALGVVCGGVAAGYRLAVVSTDRAVGGRVPWPIARGALAGLVVGALGAIGLTGVMGVGYPLIEQALHDGSELGWQMLLALLVAKVVATATMYAGRTGPGLFSPMLVVGALAGTLFGVVLETALPGLAAPAGSYGLVAMGAVTAAALEAPLAMILVLFELTGDYTVVPPTMVTVAFAMAVVRATRPGSLDEDLLGSRGIHLHRSLPAELRARPVSALMVETTARVAPDAALESVVDAFAHTRENLLWVIDDDGRYQGTIHVQDVLDALSGAAPDELVRSLPTLSPEQSTGDAVQILSTVEVDELPVVDDDGRLLGIIREHHLIEAINAMGDAVHPPPP